MVHKYLQDRIRELGAQALQRTRIYLDTNYWVVLRDHINGIRRNSECEQLLGILRHAVTSGKAICTYSSHTLHELMKHASPSTREATASVIDELSSGFCLANPERLLNNEIVHWIASDIAKLGNALRAMSRTARSPGMMIFRSKSQ